MIAETLIISTCVFAVAFMFAPIGMGGGMLFVPLLHYGLGWEINGALFAVSLSLTAVVSWGSGLAHRQNKHFDDSALKTGLWGAIPGAILGVLLVLMIGEKIDSVFKLLSLFMISWAIYNTARKMRNAPRGTEELTDIETSIEPNRLKIGAGIGGVLSSVLAVGAGVIYVPVLRSFANLEPRKAIGTSLHFMMVVVPVAIATHLVALPEDMYRHLFAERFLIMAFVVLTFLGSRSGAKYGMRYLNEKQLMQLFLLVILVLFTRYVLDLLPS